MYSAGCVHNIIIIFASWTYNGRWIFISIVMILLLFLVWNPFSSSYCVSICIHPQKASFIVRSYIIRVLNKGEAIHTRARAIPITRTKSSPPSCSDDLFFGFAKKTKPKIWRVVSASNVYVKTRPSLPIKCVLFAYVLGIIILLSSSRRRRLFPPISSHTWYILHTTRAMLYYTW